MDALLAWLVAILLVAGPALADTPSGAVPLEAQWLKGFADVIGAVGMPGVIAGLLYALYHQNKRFDSERGDLQAALREEQAYSRKIQEDRIVTASASADRLATVAVSSSNAIATAAEKNAGVLAICQEIKDGVQPLGGEHQRILANQEGLLGSVSAIAIRVGNGCRAA